MLLGNGLWGHIRKNTLKSAILLAGFIVLIALYWYAGCLAYSALAWYFPASFSSRRVARSLEALAALAGKRALATWYVPCAFVTVWFTVAWIWYGAMIRAATGAVAVERRKEPKLYNIVENLALTAGLPMPRVEIMETDALNAYAAGLSPKSATVAVTRGLLETLTPAELEAVLAHEITHIKNRDVRLMVVALIFTGAITFAGDCVRAWFRGGPRFYGLGSGHSSSSSSNDDSEGTDSNVGAFGVIAALVIAVVLLGLSQLAAVMSQFAISRAREFMADAGAVELTKDPDALISALNKISGNDAVPLASEGMRAMMISNAFDASEFMGSFFATHPPIDDRVQCLVTFAGGRQSPARRTAARSRTTRLPATGLPSSQAGGLAAGFAAGDTRPVFGRRRSVRA